MAKDNPDGKCWKCGADWIPLDHRGMCIDCTNNRDEPDELDEN